MSADIKTIGMLRRRASRAPLGWNVSSSSTNSGDYVVIITSSSYGSKEWESGKGWVMCWRESWGWNLQARVPGFQMVKSSIELLYSGRDIWSRIMRWFLRAEVEQSQGQMWGSSLKWGKGGLPSLSSGQESTLQCREHEFDSWLGK